MKYSFDIIGVAPVISFFDQQYHRQSVSAGAEYLAAYQCTLDAFLASVEELPQRRNWNLDGLVDSVIQFWLHNEEAIDHWQQRLMDAGRENLLVARVADFEALRVEFEGLLG